MTKKQHVIISIGAVTGGWLLCGFGFTTTLGSMVSTISVVFGLGISVGGFISLVLALKKRTLKKG